MNVLSGGRPCVEVRGKCPYCEYAWSADLRDIRGALLALRCLDCRQPFMVEASVSVECSVLAAAGIDAEKVLDDLASGGEQTEPPQGPPDSARHEPQHTVPLDDPASDLDPEDEGDADDGEPEGDEPRVPVRASSSPPRREPESGRRVSYDDRTRIRTAYQAELERQRERGRVRLPRGFVQGLAAKYGVSEWTIISIGRNRDSF